MFRVSFRCILLSAMDTKYSFKTRNALLHDTYIRPSGQSLTASEVYLLRDAFRLASTKAKKEMVPQCTQVDEAKHYEELLFKHLPNADSIRFLALGPPSSAEERALRDAERIADAERRLAKAEAAVVTFTDLLDRLRRTKITQRPVKVVRERIDPCSAPFTTEPNPLEYSTKVTDSQLHS